MFQVSPPEYISQPQIDARFRLPNEDKVRLTLKIKIGDRLPGGVVHGAEIAVKPRIPRCTGEGCALELPNLGENLGITRDVKPVKCVKSARQICQEQTGQKVKTRSNVSGRLAVQTSRYR